MNLNLSGLTSKVKLYFLDHPAFMYFFLLPVYLPIRSLGITFKNFHAFLRVNVSEIHFFLYIMFICGVASALLSLVVKLLDRIGLMTSNNLLIIWRSLALIVVLVFILSTIMLLNPFSTKELYMVSGVHFFCAAFVGSLIVLETKNYPLSKRINANSSKAKESVWFSVMVNAMGILAYIMFGHLVGHMYINICVGLEICFFFYIAIYKRYWLSVHNVLKLKIPFFRIIVVYSFAACICIVIGFLVYKSVFAMSVSVILFIFLFIILSKEIGTVKILTVTSTAISYGNVLCLLMTPIFILSAYSEQTALISYKLSSWWEPVISTTTTLILMYLIQRRIVKHDSRTTYQFLLFTAFVSIGLPIIMCLMSKSYNVLYIAIFFIIYSLIESVAEYGVMKNVFEEKGDKKASFLAFFYNVVVKALVPTMYLILIACLYSFLGVNMHDSLVWSSCVLVFINIVLSIAVLMYNLHTKSVFKIQ